MCIYIYTWDLHTYGMIWLYILVCIHNLCKTVHGHAVLISFIRFNKIKPQPLLGLINHKLSQWNNPFTKWPNSLSAHLSVSFFFVLIMLVMAQSCWIPIRDDLRYYLPWILVPRGWKWAKSVVDLPWLSQGKSCKIAQPRLLKTRRSCGCSFTEVLVIH